MTLCCQATYTLFCEHADLKVEIPIERLLSGVAFDTYTQRQQEASGRL